MKEEGDLSEHSVFIAAVTRPARTLQRSIYHRLATSAYIPSNPFFQNVLEDYNLLLPIPN